LQLFGRPQLQLFALASFARALTRGIDIAHRLDVNRHISPMQPIRRCYRVGHLCRQLRRLRIAAHGFDRARTAHVLDLPLVMGAEYERADLPEVDAQPVA